jgi:hypothetical protein
MKKGLWEVVISMKFNGKFINKLRLILHYIWTANKAEHKRHEFPLSFQVDKGLQGKLAPYEPKYS